VRLSVIPPQDDTRQETAPGPAWSGLAAALGGSYRIERVLGRGGMATVYLARDLKHDRDVAIKVLEAEIAAAVGADRFLTEIRTTAHLKHPHILPLFDSGSAGSSLFYVMPFIDGESLRSQLQREGRLPIDRVVAVLRELADALAYAHSRGVVHRDVKPDNVLIAERHVFLADFGVARVLAARAEGGTLTGATTMIGTPTYMSPEQTAGGQVDHRADIYAAGVLAYELLAGVPPFAGRAQDVVTAHLTRAPEPVTQHRPEIPATLANVIMRCLEKDPANRWQTANDVLVALSSVTSSTVPAAYR
jgi:serine/threonine-protein kinase